MTEKISENYFSIGEFASLFGVSKQTLFYYERNKILMPALIEENGYRYYALEQYFIFDIILLVFLFFSYASWWRNGGTNQEVKWGKF